MINWLIAGLGNPGREYDGTRHNIGFRVVDTLCGRWSLKMKKLKFSSFVAERNGVLIIKPQTFMNLSGRAVGQAARYYGIEPERTLVIFDDAALAAGKLRVRPSGSDGGHNGIKDILYHLQSDGFPRVKVGVGGKPHPEADMAAHVLSGFSEDDKKLMDEAVERAADAVELILREGVTAAMNAYNGKADNN